MVWVPLSTGTVQGWTKYSGETGWVAAEYKAVPQRPRLAGRAGSKFADVTSLWRHYPLLLLLLAAVSLLAKNSGKVLLAFYTLLIQLVIP